MRNVEVLIGGTIILYLCEGDLIRPSCYLAVCLENTIFPHIIKCMYINVHVFIVLFDEQLSMVIATTVAYVIV